MKKFLRENGIWVLAAAVVVALALNLITFFSSNTNLLTNVAGIVATPFRAAAESVSGWVEDNLRFQEEFDRLKEENAALKQELSQLQQQLRQAQVDSSENELLRQLLDLREQRRDLTDFEAAHIINQADSNWDHTLTLNRGSSHGLEISDTVIDCNGNLVGVVTEVGLNWSTVRTVLDPQLELGARIFRTDEIGVIRGDFNLMGNGQLRLDFIDTASGLMVGDLVVTSGLGGYYPAGLSIGTVTELKTDSSGTSRYAVLTPSAELSQLREVFVIKSFEIVE